MLDGTLPALKALTGWSIIAAAFYAAWVAL